MYETMQKMHLNSNFVYVFWVICFHFHWTFDKWIICRFSTTYYSTIDNFYTSFCDLCLFVCLFFFCKLKRYCSSCEACRKPKNIHKCLCNVWVVILIMTCFCNSLYHVLCCIFIRDLKDIQIEDYVLVDNIVDLIIAVLQIFFISVNYMYYDKICENSNNINKCEKWIFDKGVHILYSLLCISNMGLWISDSIRDKRLIYKADNSNDFWTLFISFLFLISIFFHFQISFEFLKLYLHRKKNE